VGVSVVVVLLLSVLDAVEFSFACGLPLPPCVLVAVAVCVTEESLFFPVSELVGFANAEPDARITAIAVAKVRLVI
jgi:hypothetical protein